jgi:hypothetical protein
MLLTNLRIKPAKHMPYPVTPDGRYFVVKGRLWRRADPALPDDLKGAVGRGSNAGATTEGRCHEVARFRKDRGRTTGYRRRQGKAWGARGCLVEGRSS